MNERRPADRAAGAPLRILLFDGVPLAPVALPAPRRLGFGLHGVDDEAVMGQSAWIRQHVGDPNRRGLLFGVTFVFPDEPGAKGIFDGNFTCRTLYSLQHYIMHQYAWPQQVRDRFPGGRVRFHDLVLLDHNNAPVTAAHYDAILLNRPRLECVRRERLPIVFTALCYKHESRASSVVLTHRVEGGAGWDARCSVVPIHHQTFLQLLYLIHRQTGRVASFYSGVDRVCITEVLRGGMVHEVTQDTYGTRVYDPDAQLRVEFTQARA